MSVSVQTSGGSVAVRQISDSFNRTTLNPAGINRWSPFTFSTLPAGNPYCLDFMSVGLLSDGLNGVQLSGKGSGVTSQYPMFAQCGGFDGSVWGVTQFVQFTFVSVTAAPAGGGGGAMMIDLNLGTCYFIDVLSSQKLRLGRIGSFNIETDFLDPVSNTPLNQYDVVRCSVTAVPAANVLTVSVNGSILATFTDGAGSLNTGIPGLVCLGVGFSAGNFGNLQLRNWSGGTGL